jgi:hypothetical protein
VILCYAWAVARSPIAGLSGGRPKPSHHHTIRLVHIAVHLLLTKDVWSTARFTAPFRGHLTSGICIQNTGNNIASSSTRSLETEDLSTYTLSSPTTSTLIPFCQWKLFSAQIEAFPTLFYQEPRDGCQICHITSLNITPTKLTTTNIASNHLRQHHPPSHYPHYITSVTSSQPHYLH